VENRSLCLAAGLSLFALCAASTLHAQEAGEDTLPEGVEAVIARGLAMQAEADRLQQEAESELGLEREACGKKILVNDCRLKAQERYLEKLNASRKLNTEGHDLEVKGRKRERDVLRAQQSSAAIARAEEDAKRAEAVAKERETREARSAARRAKRAAEAEKRAQKVAARQEAAKEKEESTARKRTEMGKKKATGENSPNSIFQ